MNPIRDPELGERLERALPSPDPRYGQQERIRRSLGERLARERRTVTILPLAVAAVLAVVAATALWKRPPATTSVTSAQSSLLTLTTAHIVVRSDGKLAVERDDPSGTVVRLSSGTILIHVQKGTGRPFTVLAGSERVDVVGTLFAVSRRNEATAVEVFEGVVRITDATGAHTAGAGERYPLGAESVPPTNEELALLSTNHGPLSAAKATLSSPSALPAGRDDAGPGAEMPPGRSTSAPPRLGPDGYAAAKALERSGATDAAIEAYGTVATQQGRNTEDALFAIVRLRAQGGDSGLALEAAERYRRAFPSGRYARAIDVHALNSRLALSDDDGVLREAAAFLESHSGDPRAFKFRLGRATVLARRGDCKGARSALEGVPNSPAKKAVVAACL